MDTTRPLFSGPPITSQDGTTITLTYNETLSGSVPANTAFIVNVAGSSRGVDRVAFSGSTIILTLATPVVIGQTVTVAYNDPTVNDDPNAVQDSAGNDAVNLAATTVTNNAVDLPPRYVSSTTNNMGNIVLNFNEALSTNAPLPGAFNVLLNGSQYVVKNVAVSGSTITLTFSAPMSYGDTARVQYLDSDDTYTIQDVAGNDTGNFGPVDVTNTLSSTDTIPPVFQSAATSANGSQIVLTYHETLSATTAAPSAFSVVVDGSAAEISTVGISGKTVVLNLATAVQSGQTVKLGYNDPSGSNDPNAVQDTAGNDAVTLAAGTNVTNNTLDTKGPELIDVLHNDGYDVIELRFNESLNTSTAYSAASKINLNQIDFSGTPNQTLSGLGFNISSVVGNSLFITSTAWQASMPITHTKDYSITYNDGSLANDSSSVIEDVSGNDAASFNILFGIAYKIGLYGVNTETLTGTNVTDFIMGSNGNETIIGGQGNDTMWGHENLRLFNSYTNNNVFKWNSGDAGLSGAIDTIKDFSRWNGLVGDRLSIYGLLSGFTPATSTLSDWVKTVATGQTVNGVANSTVMTIDVDGPGSGTVIPGASQWFTIQANG